MTHNLQVSVSFEEFSMSQLECVYNFRMLWYVIRGIAKNEFQSEKFMLW